MALNINNLLSLLGGGLKGYQAGQAQAAQGQADDDELSLKAAQMQNQMQQQQQQQAWEKDPSNPANIAQGYQNKILQYQANTLGKPVAPPPGDVLSALQGVLSTVRTLPAGQQPGYLGSVNPILQQMGASPLPVPAQRQVPAFTPGQLAETQASVNTATQAVSPMLKLLGSLTRNPALAAQGSQPPPVVPNPTTVQQTTPTYQPDLTTQAALDKESTARAGTDAETRYKDAQTQAIGKNYGLSLAQFKHKVDYDAAVQKAKSYELALEAQHYSAEDAHAATLAQIAAGNLAVSRDRLSFDKTGGAAGVNKRFGAAGNPLAVAKFNDSLAKETDSLMRGISAAQDFLGNPKGGATAGQIAGKQSYIKHAQERIQEINRIRSSWSVAAAPVYVNGQRASVTPAGLGKLPTRKLDLSQFLP